MSRIKKDRSIITSSDEAQLWQVIKTHLRTIEKLNRNANHDLLALEARRKDYLHRLESDSIEAEESLELQKALKEEYEKLDSKYEEEYQEAAKALEKVELLFALRDDISLDESSKKKKRKTETNASIASSTSPPPVIVTPSVERFASPVTVTQDEDINAASLVPPSTEKEKKRSNSKSNESSTPALPRRGTITASSKDSTLSNTLASSQNLRDSSKDNTLTSTGSSSSGYIDPAKARREVLAHQLPLKKGRKVAFRQPPKTKSGPGAANVSNMTSRSASSAAASSSSGVNNSASSGIIPQEEEGEQWIMATIIECINNDRNRYVVVDAEDPTGPTYNTTLKAIVPLPESLSTLPPEDYKIGSQVLGLYPDTSCFYQALVKGGGPGLNGSKVTVKMQKRAEEILNMPYRLEFEDDGGMIHNVPACFVVERP